ncbi:MAG TPA: YebC/PmpR family DNA-binding transcriptional regulator [Patescibacteria group bacterium]|nr:YebC/PmpR family DNA-binding transcriptional regulator [Patescibacteria group bacterium]
MSGHSKWSTIKRQKGANDAKRGLAFTKLSNAITMAVRQGGGVTDPNSNFRLRLAIDAARAVNMPKDTIDRAVQRAVGKNANEMQEVVYEGFGPGGFSVIIEAITDNKQRTTPEIKSIFDKNGGTMGVVGSVSYQFVQKGQLIVKKADKTLDEIFLLAAEAGAEDVEDIGTEVIIYTTPETLHTVKSFLEEQHLSVDSAEIVNKPIVIKDLNDHEGQRAIDFLEKLEEHNDVQKVYANFAVQEA